MKYGLGIRMLIAFMVGGVAVLYKFQLNPRYKQSEINIAIKAPRRFTFDTLTNPKNVPKYFSWVSELHESPFDKRNISLGKVYYGIVNMPFLGQHEVRYKVVEMKETSWVTLRPENQKDSWFNSEITMTFFAVTKEETFLGVKITYLKTSALFQITLGRYLRYITDQQLNTLSITAKNLVHIEWEKFRFPHGRPGKKQNKLSSKEKDKILQKKSELFNGTVKGNEKDEL